MNLSQRVRDYRYSKGWGPDELASRAAISRTALYQIESGKTELPRAGTLRRIAMALDVSMETLMGHPDANATLPIPSLPPSAPARPRGMTEWYPSEGVAMPAPGQRPTTKYDGPDLTRFAGDYGNGLDLGVSARERELQFKLNAILASPLGESLARIVEETYRLLPSARVAGSYE